MLDTTHKRYIIKHFVIGSALINAAIAYGLFAGKSQINIWGNPSLGVDIIATIFLLTLITSLIVNWSTDLALSSARVSPIHATGFWQTLIERLPQASWPRALLFSFLAVCVISPIVFCALHLLAVHSLPSASAMTFKILFAVGIGAIITPIIGFLALLKIQEDVTLSPALSQGQTEKPL